MARGKQPEAEAADQVQRAGISRGSLDPRTSILTIIVLVVAVVLGVGVTARLGLTILALSLLVSFLLPVWVPLAVALIAMWFRPLVPELPSGLLLSDVAMGIFMLRWTAPWLLYERDKRLHASSWWLLAFLAWAWIAMLFSHGEEHLALARVSAYGVLFVAASVTRGVAKPLYILAASAAVIQVAVLVASGVILVGDPHQFGQIAMAGIAGAQFVRNKLWRSALFVLSLAGVALCFRRGIWIAGAVEIGVLGLPLLRNRRGRKRLVLGVLVGAIAAFGMYQAQEALTVRLGLNEESIVLRQEGWSNAITAIQAEPIVGHGWATAVEGGQPAYNLGLNVAASVGILGAVLVAGFFAALVLTLSKRSDRESVGVFAYLMGFLVLSMAEMTFYAAAAGTAAFFVLLGAAVGERRHDRSPER